MNLKSEILSVFRNRFKSSNIEPPTNIEIMFEKGKQITLTFDGEPTDKMGMAEHMFMKTFLINQLKSHLTKQTAEKTDITFAITSIDLQTDVITLKCFYDTKTNKNNLFTHSL